MHILNKVKKFIEEKELIIPGSSILVGVSGGADSMALLHILITLGYKCIAAHCNFHLRGSESDRDYFFVKSFCKDNGIEFVSVDFDTFKYMTDNSVSLEMAARELRYQWFDQVSTSYNTEKIAIAHHRDDSAETVLINLIRGTGIKGLTGIPASNGKIIRPLLCLFRDEIIDYLNINKITFVEDSTNNENIYIRNKIRLDIIPLLKSLNPSVIEAINKTAENLVPVENLYNSTIYKAKQRVVSANKINIDLLLKEDEPETLLFEILYKYGFNPVTVRNIYSSLLNQSGKIFYSEKYRLTKDRENLILNELEDVDKKNIYLIKEQDLLIDQPIGLKIELIENNPDFKIEKNKKIVYLDKDKITYPLIIRHWQQGDRFIPFGMKGSKKLSDYFSDHKFSIPDKENIWLLCTSDKIIWIIGERADDRFKVTPKTKNILRISI